MGAVLLGTFYPDYLDLLEEALYLLGDFIIYCLSARRTTDEVFDLLITSDGLPWLFLKPYMGMLVVVLHHLSEGGDCWNPEPNCLESVTIY